MNITSDKILSARVRENLPQYVSEDYPTFVLFLEAYFEYLEQTGNPYFYIKNLNDQKNVDLALNEFLNHFETVYLNLFPLKVYSSVEKRNVIKNIKKFYLAKGTEKSIQFLFKLLFNDEISIYYPKKDLLICDDGKYYVPKSIFCSNTINIEKYVGGKVYHTLSGFSAFVEDYSTYISNNITYGRLFLSNIVGVLPVNVSFSAKSVDGVVYTNSSVGIVSSLSVSSGGDNFAKNDYFDVSDGTLSSRFYIDRVVGGISSISVISAGQGYQKTPRIKILGTGVNTKTRVNLAKVGVQKIQIIDGGSGYNAMAPPSPVFQTVIGAIVPTVSFTIVSGKITAVNIIGTGDGYASPPTITLDDSVNGNLGSNASFDVFLLPTKIESVDILNPGEKFNSDFSPTITLENEVLYVSVNSESAILEANVSGKIIKFRQQEYTLGFVPTNTLTIQANSVSGFGSILIPKISTLLSEDGFFLNNDGFLSSKKYLQDDYFYQPFSYVINTKQSVSTYRNALENIVHPAGMRYFGNIRYQNEGKIGPTLRTFENSKTFYKPFERMSQAAPDAPNNLLFTTPSYEGMTQFKDLTFSDVTLNQKKSTNYTPSPHIKVYKSTVYIPQDSIIEYDFLPRTSSQILYDIRAPYYNGSLGNQKNLVDGYDPTWVTAGLLFNNSIVDCRSAPVSPVSQTIIAAFKVSSLNAPMSLVGCLDSESAVTGYAIDLNLDRSLSFRVQKRANDANTYFNIVSTAANSLDLERWYVVMLRYNANTIEGKINLQNPVSSIFGVDVDTLGSVNNSSGYYLGVEGYSSVHSSPSSNTGEVLLDGGQTFDSTLFDKNPPNFGEIVLNSQSFESTQNSIQGSFDESTFNSTIFNDTTSVNRNIRFIGTMGYALVYNRYITNLEYAGIFTSLQTKLALRGISITP